METLGEEYLNHKVFEQLSEFIDFYSSLSYTTMTFVNLGTQTIINLDSYVFTSIKGTLESIKEILLKGRINDAYALLRKYYDCTIINVYTNLYLQDNFNIENFIVKEINDWILGKQRLPDYRCMIDYIRKSEKLKPITDLLLKDDHYKDIRDRCNNHTHYNYYYYLLQNDNEIHLPGRVKLLDIFFTDLLAVFIQHFAYLFYLNDYYMASTYYIDCIDVGITPEDGSQYWVSPFIQKTFDKWIKPYRPDIALLIKSHTSMKLE
jgi:hypothetical protein